MAIPPINTIKTSLSKAVELTSDCEKINVHSFPLNEYGKESVLEAKMSATIELFC